MSATFVKTRVKNVSGSQITISGLGATKTLSDGEHITLLGGFSGWLAANHPGIKARRLLKKFWTLVDDGDLEIVEVDASTSSSST